MAYPPSCGVLGRAKDVIGGFEWEQDVLTGLDGAERRRHLDAVRRAGAVWRRGAAGCAEDWVVARLGF